MTMTHSLPDLEVKPTFFENLIEITIQTMFHIIFGSKKDHLKQFQNDGNPFKGTFINFPKIILFSFKRLSHWFLLLKLISLS